MAVEQGVEEKSGISGTAIAASLTGVGVVGGGIWLAATGNVDEAVEFARESLNDIAALAANPLDTLDKALEELAKNIDKVDPDKYGSTWESVEIGGEVVPGVKQLALDVLEHGSAEAKVAAIEALGKAGVNVDEISSWTQDNPVATAAAASAVAGTGAFIAGRSTAACEHDMARA